MSRDLTGKVAVVTGGSRGIGQAVVLDLISAGATVVIAGVSDSSDTQSRAREVRKGEADLTFVRADVTSAEDVRHMTDQVLEQRGHIHILVNNAGINRDGLLVRMKDQDWDDVLTTNLRGTFFCTRAALAPMIKERWGRIINITSVVGMAGNAGQANYAAAKAGIIGLTKTTAKEVASRGITVNAVAPGFIDTDMTRKLSDKVKEQVIQQVPLKRFGTPEDVARAVTFLASEDAGYITGHVLTVDGGLVMA